MKAAMQEVGILVAKALFGGFLLAGVALPVVLAVRYLWSLG